MTMQSGDELTEALKKKLAAEGDEDPLPEIIKGIQSMLGDDSGDGDSPLSELVKELQELQHGGGGGGSLQGAIQAMLQGDDEDDGGGSLQGAIEGMLQDDDEDGDDSSPWGGISGGIPQGDEGPPLGDVSQALKDAMQSGANDGDGLSTLQAALQAMQDQPDDDDPSLSEVAQAVKDAMPGEPGAGPTASDANDEAMDLAEKQKDLLDSLKERRPDPDADEGGEPGARVELQSSDGGDSPGGPDDPPPPEEVAVEVGPLPPDPGDPPSALQLRTDHVLPATDSEDGSSSAEAALASVAQQGAGDAGQDAESAANDTDGLMDAKNEVKEELNGAEAGQGVPSLQTLTDPDDEPSVLIDLRSSTPGPVRLGSDFEPHVAEDHGGGADDDSEFDD